MEAKTAVLKQFKGARVADMLHRGSLEYQSLYQPPRHSSKEETNVHTYSLASSTHKINHNEVELYLQTLKNFPMASLSRVIAAAQCLRDWSKDGIYEPTLPLHLLEDQNWQKLVERAL